MSWIKKIIFNKYSASIVRHVLTTLAGVLAASTIPGAAQLGAFLMSHLGEIQEILITAIIGGGALGWSFMDKKKDIKKK